jgi:hypothetical protein
MLDLIDEAFNQVPLTIEVSIILSLLDAITPRRNDSLDACCGDGFDQLSVVVALIGDQRLAREAFNQDSGVRAVMTLAARQEQAERVA